MIIKELYQPITDYKTIQKYKKGIFKIEQGLIIHFFTGFYQLKSILVQGHEHEDISSIVDGIVEQDKNILPLYTIEELEKDYLKSEMEEVLNDMVSINGGEFYTNAISHIESID